MKCEFPQNENVCKRCRSGGHPCIVEGRKPRSAPKWVTVQWQSLLFADRMLPCCPFATRLGCYSLFLIPNGRSPHRINTGRALTLYFLHGIIGSITTLWPIGVYHLLTLRPRAIRFPANQISTTSRPIPLLFSCQSFLSRPDFLWHFRHPMDATDADSPSAVQFDLSDHSKREYLLAQIRQKDAIIESLLKQVRCATYPCLSIFYFIVARYNDGLHRLGDELRNVAV